MGTTTNLLNSEVGATCPDGTEMPIELALLSNPKHTEIEVLVEGVWRRVTNWSMYRGEAHVRLYGHDRGVRGPVGGATVVRARSATLRWHGDHWCTRSGRWA